MEMPHSFWNAPSIDRTKVHEISARLEGTVLIVFVHGFRGDPGTTWGDLPKWLLKSLGVDMDMISYGYPTAPWSRASVGDAAAQLQRILLKMASRYMHLVFLSHSTGGLVVKELLTSDVESIAADKAHNSLSSLPAIAGKTRLLFNFAVPHQGASRIYSVVLRGRAFINYVFCLIIGPVRILLGGFRELGKNRLHSELLHGSDYVTGLTRRFRDALDRLLDNDWPRPRMVEFIADDDPVIAPHANDLGPHGKLVEHISEPDNHRSVKTPSAINDTIIRDIADRISLFVNAPEMTISYVTFRRVVNLDGNARPAGDPAEQSGGQDNVSEGKWAPRQGSQARTLKDLISVSMPREAREHPRVLIIGDAGVGKSVVLRRYARHLATRFLEGDREAAVCLFLPMQQMTLKKEDLATLPPIGNPSMGWRTLGCYWSDLVKEILLDPREEMVFGGELVSEKIQRWEAAADLITPGWVVERGFYGPSKVIFDGTDEFLTNHPSLTVETMSQLLTELESSSRDGANQCFVAARSTLPAVEELSRHRDDVYEITPLSEGDAESLFPGSTSVLQGVEDTKLRRLLLTPLVLLRLGPNVSRVKPQGLDSRATILRYALNALIEQSQLTARETASRESASLEAWSQALALTAWIFYRDSKGYITVTDQLRGVKDLKALWTRTDVDIPRFHRFSEGFGIFDSKAQSLALRSRTVLTSAGRNAFRFTHREWQDLLVSEYVAQCVLGEMFAELTHRALDKQLYIDVAELLWRDMKQAKQSITAEWVDRALGGSPHSRPYILMNTCALLGNGPVTLDQAALRKLLDVITCQHCPEVARLVAVSSFGMRVLRKDTRDDSVMFMRKDICNAFGRIVEQDNSVGRVISASMAWCYRTQLFNRFPELRPANAQSWPKISATDPRDVAAVGASGIVWQVADGEPSVDGRCRSFQIAAAQYPLAVRDYPQEEISLSHYLLLVCAAVTARTAVGEVFPLLRAVFSKESNVARRIEDYDLTEVRRLFKSCQEAVGILLQEPSARPPFPGT